MEKQNRTDSVCILDTFHGIERKRRRRRRKR
jgi:hypothetical protein